ncbi:MULTISPECIES: fructosamine kinase family protein [unclassified Crossiella]|uniref:fructosamine kinase family protein n=1 Tax=unclassified Crossiella TaxID=2620835 RepID=UPI001FFF20DF|nr:MULTISPECIES: fructosamine kinase family protein [unclassified Crossiella]MCK2240776.1 fructosamine kinase family protein [Crossiella sp. S99.2]MCK2254080.1 fructosamine kinase family protein [Crossiella sp. S99.1]
MSAAAAIARLTGVDPVAVRPAGGSAAEVFRARLADGRQVVAKSAAAGSSVAEAAGLRWLAAANAVPIPAVLGHDETWLVLDWVPPGEPGPAAAERFGRELAALHTSGATAFGCPPPGGPADAWIGAAPMRNEPHPDWPEFFATQRLEPYLRTADLPELTPVREVCDRIAEYAGPPEPPARLHGDLWSGNVLWGADGVHLIDPAAHGGHQESDLAMLALFGCPHLDRILGAYQEVAPLAEGWRDRVPLHQLFPLLVHVVLFGGSYGERTVAAARAVRGRPPSG